MRAVRPHRCTKALKVHDIKSKTVHLLGRLGASGSPGTAGGVVLQHPVHVRDVDASGHDVGADQDAAAATQTVMFRHAAKPPSPPKASSPLEFAEVCKDAVSFVLHLSVNAANRNLPHKQLQGAAIKLHAGAGAAATGHTPLPH